MTLTHGNLVYTHVQLSECGLFTFAGLGFMYLFMVFMVIVVDGWVLSVFGCDFCLRAGIKLNELSNH